MTDFKLFLPKFDGSKSSDYRLWMCRLEAVLEDQNIAFVLQERPSAGSSASDAAYSAACKKAAAIIINGLADKPLRVVVSHRKDPAKMMEKLNERYASSSFSTRMSLMSELHNMSYVRNADMAEFVDSYTSLLDRLEAMEAKVPEPLAVIMFLHSMRGQFEATVAALRTMGDDELSWDDVTSRFIEEASSVGARTRRDTAFLTMQNRVVCDFCGRSGHQDDRCWTNPSNPNNRLGTQGFKGPSKNKGKRAASAQVAALSPVVSQSAAAVPTTQGGSVTLPAVPNASLEHAPQGLSGNSEQPYHLLYVQAAPAALSAERRSGTSHILVDSGASKHMCPHRDLFSEIRKCEPSEIVLGDDSVLVCREEGTVRVPIETEYGSSTLSLYDVLLVPELRHTLVSCSALSSTGISTYFLGGDCLLYDTSSNGAPKLVARCTQTDGLYRLPSVIKSSSHHVGSTFAELSDQSRCGLAHRHVASSATGETPDVHTWHRRLGHTGVDKICALLRQGLLPNVSSKRAPCADCVAGKQHRHPFPGTFSDALKPGDIIHSDVVGPLPPSHSGLRYLVSFIDEFTRYATIFAMTHKSDVLHCFQTFVREFERLHDTKIKAIHSDNGGEYAPVAKYADELGIMVQRSAPYTPQSNGISERQNRSIFEMVRSSLAASGLSRKFWVEAAKNAVYIRNRIPESSGVSPFEKLFGRAPSITGIRPLGCLAYMLQHESARRKLDDKSLRCVLLANLDHGNYRLLDISTNKVHVSRHVEFDETVYPMRTRELQGDIGAGRADNQSNVELVQQRLETDECHTEEMVETPEPPVSGIADHSVSDDSADAPDSEPSEDENVEVVTTSSELLETDADAARTDEQIDATVSAGESRYPLRTRRSPGQWWAFHTDTAECHLHGSQKPLSPDANQACHMHKAEESDSPTLREALNSPNRDLWEVSIAEELESLREAGTWEVAVPPRGAKVFPSRFVLKVKRNSDGSLERRKARLVLMGNFQRPHIDYFDTYAPVADFVVVRIVFAMACAKGWVVHQLDVKSAFLNGYLEEEIYMKLPGEYARADGKVCKLNRAIYGLRQAPRAWSKRLCDDLKGCGFTSLVNAESVFQRMVTGTVVYLIIYVDDILVASASEQAAVMAKDSLGKLYKVKDLGKAEYFLGVKIEREQNLLRLSQESYINSVLERYGMQDAKPVVTPMVQSSDLMAKSPRSDSEASRMVGVPYREAIGSLLYLAIRTRPDISVAVSVLAKHVQEPKPCHWEGVKRVLRYLKGTAKHGLCYASTGPDPTLKIYCDADWAFDPEDRHSRSGVVCYLGNSLVAWKSRKQATPSVSSCEAEYISLFEAGRDAVWIRSLLCELGMCAGKIPTRILHDNQGSIAWAQGGMRKVKHVELKYHHTQYLIETEQIQVEYVESSMNAADVMTKALCGKSFQKALEMLSIA